MMMRHPSNDCKGCEGLCFGDRSVACSYVVDNMRSLIRQAQSLFFYLLHDPCQHRRAGPARLAHYLHSGQLHWLSAVVVLLEVLWDTGLLQSHNPCTKPPVIVSADWNKFLPSELLGTRDEVCVDNVCNCEV